MQIVVIARAFAVRYGDIGGGGFDKLALVVEKGAAIALEAGEFHAVMLRGVAEVVASGIGGGDTGLFGNIQVFPLDRHYAVSSWWTGVCSKIRTLD